jgi:glyoxylase-like metal-dependent hydrolase (beta-lactamase superfamily II)
MNLLKPFVKFALFAPLALTGATAFSAPAKAPLQLQVYNAPAQSFHVNAVLVTGATEAAVIDSGFSRADAMRIAANVLDSGKNLTTIFISNADPDFYFGAELLQQQFPQAKLVTTAAVRAKIEAKMAGKLAFWAPKMGANAPSKVLLPALLGNNQFTIDGEVVEVRGAAGVLAHRPYTYIPSIHAVVGNIAVFGQLHVWTADTQSAAERAAWLTQLDELQALKPTRVVPGHMLPGTVEDASTISYTRDYLLRFEQEAGKAENSAALIKAMQQAYPNAGLGIALDIGAKVKKGEMQW